MIEEEVVVHRHQEDVTFSGKFAEAVFSKKIGRFELPPNREDTTVSELVDPMHKYVLNSHGHRGPDFQPNVDILAAGCSQTYGVGVPESGSWPAQMARITGMSYANLSLPGVSIEWIVDAVMSYFYEFGHPKYVFVLFPDLFRGEMAVNINVNESRDTSVNDFFAYGADLDENKGVIPIDSLDPRITTKAKLSKRPHYIEDTLAVEEAVRRSIKAIRYLEQYCNATGVKLYWYSWSSDLVNLARTLPEEYKFDNYTQVDALENWVSVQGGLGSEPKVDIKIDHDPNNENSCTDEMYRTGECTCYSSCHGEYKEQYGESFHYGTDRFVAEGPGHMGVHKLIHLAEDFVKIIESNP